MLNKISIPTFKNSYELKKQQLQSTLIEKMPQVVFVSRKQYESEVRDYDLSTHKSEPKKLLVGLPSIINKRQMQSKSKTEMIRNETNKLEVLNKFQSIRFAIQNDGQETGSKQHKRKKSVFFEANTKNQQSNNNLQYSEQKQTQEEKKQFDKLKRRFSIIPGQVKNMESILSLRQIVNSDQVVDQSDITQIYNNNEQILDMQKHRRNQSSLLENFQLATIQNEQAKAQIRDYFGIQKNLSIKELRKRVTLKRQVNLLQAQQVQIATGNMTSLISKLRTDLEERKSDRRKIVYSRNIILRKQNTYQNINLSTNSQLETNQVELMPYSTQNNNSLNPNFEFKNPKIQLKLQENSLTSFNINILRHKEENQNKNQDYYEDYQPSLKENKRYRSLSMDQMFDSPQFMIKKDKEIVLQVSSSSSSSKDSGKEDNEAKFVQFASKKSSDSDIYTNKYLEYYDSMIQSERMTPTQSQVHNNLNIIISNQALTILDKEPQKLVFENKSLKSLRASAKLKNMNIIVTD
eukprot:403332635